MVDNDQRRTMLRKIFHALHGYVHRYEYEQFRHAAHKEAKQLSCESQFRQLDQVMPPPISYMFRRGGWLILHTHRDTLRVKAPQGDASPDPHYVGGLHVV